MELEIMQSRKGTKVVATTQLFAVLELPKAQYGTLIRRWLRDLYEFHDGGIRRPQPLRDYAKRPRPNEPIEDYYVTLELAKLIALRSSSKVKLRYARLFDTIAHNGQMSLFNAA
jgi:phage anti-repressor protein